MKRMIVTSLSAAVLVFAAGAAMASAVFDVWGYGSTWQDARADAWSVGAQTCIGMGYQGADVEIVQIYDSGGTYVAYGIAQCY